MITPFKKRTSSTQTQDPGQFAFPLVDNNGALLVSIAGSANPDPSLPSKPSYLNTVLYDSENNIDIVVDMLGYRKWSVHIIITDEAEVKIQTSLDGINWFDEVTEDKSVLLSFEGVIHSIKASIENNTENVKIVLLAAV